MAPSSNLDKIESKLAELEPRVSKLEQDYDRDISAMLEILKKIETRMTGAVDSNEVGLISEVKDVKRELSEHKKELGQIKECIQSLKEELEKYKKYRWIIYGSILTLGWLMKEGYLQMIK